MGSLKKTSSAGPALSAPISIRILQSATVVASLFALAAISAYTSQLCLSPVYGGYPVKRYHDALITTSFTLGTVFAVFELPFSSFSKFAIPVLAFSIPAIQDVLSRQSGAMGPIYGPLITEAFTVAPLTVLISYWTILRVRAQIPNGYHIIRLGATLLTCATFYAASKSVANTVPRVLVLSPYLTRTSLELLIASGYTLVLPSFTSVLLALPAIIHTVGFNPHFVSSVTTTRLNTELATHGYAILDRRESVTGYISVVEAKNNYKALRCDHSLLGGEFSLTPERVQMGMTQKETIYGVFTMLESVRLVEVPAKRGDNEASALIIGLGIGTSPTALIKLGINTTVVEIDPVVHEFAVKYFGLPEKHKSVLEDAIGFVAKQSADPFSHKYDYIIHDVFTGGVEPTALFTVDFLQGLETLLDHSGVIAINYASEISSSSTQLVMKTIFSIFPSCRVYKETSPDIPDTEDFANMVVFCTKQANVPISFRAPNGADWAQSLSRRQFIPPKPEWEIKFDFTGDREDKSTLLRSENQNEIDQYALELTTSHWEVMRRVMPDIVWQLW